MIEKRDGDLVNVNGGGDNPSAPQTISPDLLYRGTSMEPVWDDDDDFGNVPAWELFEQASSVKPGGKPASPASQPVPPQSHRPPAKPAPVEVAKPASQPTVTPKAPSAPVSEPKAAAPKVSPKGADEKLDDKKQDDGKNGGRTLHITFHRSGNLDRDKFRLKEIYERVRDPRGKDHFSIVVDTQGQRHLLQFPNDPCTISDRLTTELEKHFKLEVNVE